MFDDQHDCQNGSSVSLCTPACMRVAFSATTVLLSALTLALLLIKETVFLSGCRQASERQELPHKCTCPIVDCLEPEIC